MPTPISMPKLGMSMQEGRVVAWPLAIGERVRRGEPVLVIESEKAEVEIEATAGGFFRHVYVEVGETVPCGTLLAAMTDTPDEPFDSGAFRDANDRPEAPRAASGAGSPSHAASDRKTIAAAAAATSAMPATAARVPPGARKPIAPAARARARELGVDAEQAPGTGPGGRVTREDVEAFAARRSALTEVAPGVALEAPAAGSGDPVVLLPGFGTDVSVFARQTPVLGASFRVTGVNPRGISASDAPAAQAYDVATMAADAARCFEGRAHVVGASLGAAAAIELALAHPERVRSLVLVTPFVTASPRLLAVLGAWTAIAREARPATLAATLLPWLFGDATLADARTCERIARGLAEIAARAPAATLERQAAGLRAWSGTRESDLARITAPTLVVAGGADLLAPDAERVARAIPKATLVAAPGAGHAVALEAPDTVNDAILAHLHRS